MIRYSSTVTIARPPRAVYEALLDPQRYGEWTDMVEMRFDTPDEPAVGSRGSFELAKGPIKGRLTTEITELVPDRSITIHIEHPSLDWTSVSRLEPVADGTRLEYSGAMRLRGWRRVLEPLMAAEIRAGEGKEAERLKALLEASSSAAAATT